MHAKHILALDFDGLLVDGLDECVLVTWNGHLGHSVDLFSDEGLRSIPKDFVKRFEHHRSFAKHLGHFFMPFQAGFERFRSQADFDAAYATLDAGAVEAFIARVSRYRADARIAYRERWLNYHRFYPGLDEMLRGYAQPVCIVTAKDSGSVQELLSNAGIHLPDTHVFGDCREKIGALDLVAETFGVERGSISFFDDNVLNARDALRAGFRSNWAVWGYHTREHFDIARDAGLPAAELEDLRNFGVEVLV